jgi:hypothetical protein
MKSEFQARFQINDEFYTGEQIRRAVAECFPCRSGKYDDLARLVFCGRPTHAVRELDLETLIPDIGNMRRIPHPLPNNYCYGVIEHPIKDTEIQASTFFIPTDIGYICDEMDITFCDESGLREIKVYSEQSLAYLEKLHLNNTETPRK